MSAQSEHPFIERLSSEFVFSDSNETARRNLSHALGQVVARNWLTPAGGGFISQQLIVSLNRIITKNQADRSLDLPGLRRVLPNNGPYRLSNSFVLWDAPPSHRLRQLMDAQDRHLLSIQAIQQEPMPRTELSDRKFSFHVAAYHQLGRTLKKPMKETYYLAPGPDLVPSMMEQALQDAVAATASDKPMVEVAA